jgi:hypothetical protein
VEIRHELRLELKACSRRVDENHGLSRFGTRGILTVCDDSRITLGIQKSCLRRNAIEIFRNNSESS